MRDTLIGLTTVVILFGLVYMTQTKNNRPNNFTGKKENIVESRSNLTSEENKSSQEEKKSTLLVNTEKVEETTAPNVTLSNEEKRAQIYIDRDWMPDENIDKDTYLRLGGRYTKYWDDLNKESTDSNTPPNTTQETVISN